MSQEILKSQLNQIMEKIAQKPISLYFEKLPDEKQEKNYYSIVKTPMCFEIIKNKISDNKYFNIDDFTKDFNLIYQNTCQVYGDKSLTIQMFDMLYEIMNKEISMNCLSNHQKIIQNCEKLPGIDKDFFYLSKILNSKFDIYQLDASEINKLVDSIKDNSISLKSIFKYFKCKRTTLLNFLKNNYNIDLGNLKCGRKPLNISDELIQKFSEIHNSWEGGYKGIGNILNISEWHSRKIHNILYPPKQKEKKEIVHDSRYHATRVNYLWHCDIHFLKDKPPYFEKVHYLIAFIDDYSRKIIYFEIGEYKTMEFAAQALNNCLSNFKENEYPFEITTDNGKEFTGNDFEEELKKSKIFHYKIRPRNPEENAKIERWWPIVEKLKDYKDIPIIVFIYNNILFHSALKNYFEDETTPETAYNQLPKFDIERDGVLNIIEYTP